MNNPDYRIYPHVFNVLSQKGQHMPPYFDLLIDPYDKEEVVATAETLMRRHPDVGAIVSECTNLAPFTYDISQRLGIPVFDTVTMVNLFHASLRPRRYDNS